MNFFKKDCKKLNHYYLRLYLNWNKMLNLQCQRLQDKMKCFEMQMYRPKR